MSGLSLALAWATTPTSYLYAVPFLAVAAWASLRDAKLKGLYRLALFLLAAPAMAVVLERSLSHNRLKWLVILLFIGSLPWVLCNFSRPLVTYPFVWEGNPCFPQVFEGGKNTFTTARTDQYFSNHWKIRDSYVRTADYLAARGIKQIGVELGADDWEYPFFPLLKKRAQAPIRIEHVIRKIGSDKNKAVTTKGFTPEAIICLKS